MPFKIPTRPSEAQLPQQLGIRTAEASDFLSGFEKPAASMAEILGARAKELDDANDIAAYYDNLSKLNTESQRIKTLMSGIQGNPSGLYKKELEAWTQDRRDSFKNGIKNQQYKAVMDYQINKHLDSVSELEAALGKKWRSDVLNNTVDQITRSASNIPSDQSEALTSAIGQLRTVYAGLAPQDQDGLRKAESKLLENNLRANAAVDPVSTKRVWERDRDAYRGILDDRYEEVNKYIETAESVKIAKEEADAKKAADLLDETIIKGYITKAGQAKNEQELDALWSSVGTSKATSAAISRARSSIEAEKKVRFGEEGGKKYSQDELALLSLADSGKLDSGKVFTDYPDIRASVLGKAYEIAKSQFKEKVKDNEELARDAIDSIGGRLVVSTSPENFTANVMEDVRKLKALKPGDGHNGRKEKAIEDTVFNNYSIMMTTNPRVGLKLFDSNRQFIEGASGNAAVRLTKQAETVRENIAKEDTVNSYISTADATKDPNRYLNQASAALVDTNLEPGMRKEVHDILLSRHNAEINKEENLKKQGRLSIQEQISQLIRTGDTKSAIAIIGNASPELFTVGEKNNLKKNINEAVHDLDPNKDSQLLSDIDTGMIRNKDDIYNRVNSGGLGANHKKYIDYFDTVKRQKEQEGLTANYYLEGLDAFNELAKKVKTFGATERSKFSYALRRAMNEAGITAFDPKVIDITKELLTGKRNFSSFPFPVEWGFQKEPVNEPVKDKAPQTSAKNDDKRKYAGHKADNLVTLFFEKSGLARTPENMASIRAAFIAQGAEE